MEEKRFTVRVLDGKTSRKQNGFILLEMVLASSLTALILLAVLPAAVQAVRMFENGLTGNTSGRYTDCISFHGFFSACDRFVGTIPYGPEAAQRFPDTAGYRI